MNILGVRVPIERPHWFAVRKICNDYYNLDSKLPVPQCLGNENNLFAFLKDNLTSNSTQLFLVLTKEMADAKLWKH